MGGFRGDYYLYDFASKTYRAKSSADLDVAADYFAKAVSILGIQAVLAVLFKGAKAPRTGKGAPLPVGNPPPRTPGARYKPKAVQDPAVRAGNGWTSFWGDITVSTAGSATDRALVLIHEKVHQFLAPKLYILRSYRVQNRANSYVRSSLWRYLEEALAETVAQVGVNGFSQFFKGIRFPVENGYMFLFRGGGYDAAFRGSGLVAEGAALLYNGSVLGIAFELWFRNSPAIIRPASSAGAAP